MDQFGYYNQNYQYTNIINNRVYINPNFNKNVQHSVPCVSNSNVYFNPNFTHNAQQIVLQQREQINRPKIHVNPNFFRPNVQKPVCVNTPQSVVTNSLPSISSLKNPRTKLAYTQQEQADKEYGINTQNVNKSRYCLVRQKENEAMKSSVIKTLTSTVKVNKYKLVSLSAVKKNLATDKHSNNKIIQNTANGQNLIKTKSKYRITSKPIINNGQNTRFKFVKRNSIISLLNSQETKLNTVKRLTLTHNKSSPITTARQTKKNMKGSFKKNNMPCPLYKKYGKCLRLARGSCDYLHDKKHVSICRKFLKGICHDKQCLLSHDLTDKKMPTCYFFLQGICTKEDCPYLHVKLNEKTKICPDFVKGYCEKGDKCLYRHVNISPEAAPKSTSGRKSNSKRRTREDKTKCRKTNLNKKYEKTAESISEKVSSNDHRYFREAEDTTPEKQCDLIKPTRCKLGILPSFIQL